MSFAESFVACMQNAGVDVHPDSVTEEGHFTEAVQYMKSWYDGLDAQTREAMDAATSTEEPVAYLLADANVAPGVPALLDHFDAAVGWSLSTLLDWCLHCIGEASQAGAGQPEQHEPAEPSGQADQAVQAVQAG